MAPADVPSQRGPGRLAIEDDLPRVRDYLGRALRAEDIRRDNPRRYWIDIAAEPGVGLSESDLRKWRSVLVRAQAMIGTDIRNIDELLAPAQRVLRDDKLRRKGGKRS